jgi:hypothetical protein
MFAALVLGAVAFVPRARATTDEGFDLSVSKGQVTVTAAEGWHINAEYPWKLVVGDTKLDKSRFALNEKTAVVTGAPPGTGTLRGGVCAAGKCRTLALQVTIP